MLKKRIIPIQLLLKGRLVKSVQFGQYRDVGDPVASSRVYNSQNADELIFLNIDPNPAGGIEPLIQVLDEVAKVCFMPLALGGGIRTLDDAVQLIAAGADKVVLNSACYRNPGLITAIAERFGSQAVVVAIDVKWDAVKRNYVLYSAGGTQAETVDLVTHIENCQGMGEILLQSIDRDGVMQGYDLPLVKQVMTVAKVPVIICGGAGNYNHLKEVFLEVDVSAVACGSLFNFTDSNLIRAKAFLSNYQLRFKVT
jgi:cyclase